MCSPLKDFHKTSKWYEDEFLRDLKTTSPAVTNAFNRLTFEIMNYSLTDFHKMYSGQEEDHFLFGSLNQKSFWDHYYSVAESTIWLKKLLIFQYARSSMNDDYIVQDKNWKGEVYDFVRLLMNVLNRKNGKKNTIYFLSQPNAGKTFFMDCIADYFLSVGHLKVWNRTSGFPLEELDGARVAFWNEPNFDSGNIEEMLKLLGGDKLSAAIKFQRSATISNLPVLVTSNYAKFPKTDEFNQRIIYQNWSSCNMLKPVGKKRIHPYALDLLFTDCEQYFEEQIR